MTTGLVRSMGSELYMVEAITTTDPTIRKFVCPTGISGLGGPSDKLEVTCLDATEDKEYVRGLGDPGTVSVPFQLIPRDMSHQVLFALKAAGTTVSWLAALSDGTTQPTTLDSDDVIVPPANRTSFGFLAYIADIAIDIATNSMVKGTLTLQRSGAITPTWWNGV